MQSYLTETTGKWILAGEHAVLRGGPALVFPFYSKKLKLDYAFSDQQLELILSGQHGEELNLIFWGVLEKACDMAGVSRSSMTGKIKIENHIPIGAGLGASAALCVAVSQWFSHNAWIQKNNEYEFARNLENLFHGESSGVDIAVALQKEPIKFFRKGDRSVLQTKWQPYFYLTYSGKRGVTLDCVNKVKSLHQSNSQLAQQIDEDMVAAVKLAEKALLLNEQQGFDSLAASMELAQSCFVRWGLVDESSQNKINELIKAGAKAVKITGSGDGGFILSLWDQPQEGSPLLMPAFIQSAHS